MISIFSFPHFLSLTQECGLLPLQGLGMSALRSTKIAPLSSSVLTFWFVRLAS
jgi:hypothetical protein